MCVSGRQLTRLEARVCYVGSLCRETRKRGEGMLSELGSRCFICGQKREESQKSVRGRIHGVLWHVRHEDYSLYLGLQDKREKL